MSALPRIAISLDADGARERYELKRTYVDAVRGAGGLPILVPFVGPGEAKGYLDLCDGLVLSGGVAANSRLRAAFLAEAATFEGVEVFLPPPRLCTDNAAMIAVAGTEAFRRGERATLDLNADPAWRI